LYSVYQICQSLSTAARGLETAGLAASRVALTTPAFLAMLLLLQAGQSASVAAAPKSAAKGKKAAAGADLSPEAKSAMALLEAAAAQLPVLDKDRCGCSAAGTTCSASPTDNPCSCEMWVRQGWRTRVSSAFCGVWSC